MITTLREHEDGYLYLVDAAISFDEPVLAVSWWPLGMKAGDFKRSYGPEPLGQEMHSLGGGLYQGRQDGRLYRLRNGGATIAAYVETRSIPRPRCRAQTRWRNGRWEKRLARGWAAA